MHYTDQLYVIIVAYLAITIICLMYSTRRLLRYYMIDRSRLNDFNDGYADTYFPTLRVKDVVSSLLLSVVPAVNVYYFALVVLPVMYFGCQSKIKGFLDKPLVPRNK